MVKSQNRRCKTFCKFTFFYHENASCWAERQPGPKSWPIYYPLIQGKKQFGLVGSHKKISDPKTIWNEIIFKFFDGKNTFVPGYRKGECGCDLAQWLERLTRLPMPKSQQSWVRSQHPPTQWNLRGGRWSSVEPVHRKKSQKSPVRMLRKACKWLIEFLTE